MEQNPRTIVFITGSIENNNCWDNWQTFFQDNGHRAIAPPWPDGLSKPTLKQLIHHYETVVKSFPEKPIVIGHGMGGLITQVLVNRGIVSAGVAIHSIAPSYNSKIDFKKAHPPLLFTSGGKDTVIPAHLNYRNYEKYTGNNSVTAYKEFPGRTHLVLSQPTWREDAEYILDWVDGQFHPEPLVKPAFKKPLSLLG